MNVARLKCFQMCVRRLAVLAIFSLGASVAGAQSSTQDPLSALKSLSSDQQQSLLQGVLGGKSDGTSKKDPKLDMPETIDHRNDRLNGRDDATNRGKTADGRTLRQTDEDPELRAGDY